MAAAVVPPRGARVGVAEGVLNVLQCCAEPEGLGGVGVAEAVRGDPGREAGVAAESAELGVGQPVAVAALTGPAEEDAAGGAAGQVVVEGPDDRGGEGDAGGLAALAGDLEDAVAVVVGAGPLSSARPETLSWPLAFAAGAVLASLADTLMPEAYEDGGPVVALSTAAGFVLSYVLATL